MIDFPRWNRALPTLFVIHISSVVVLGQSSTEPSPKVHRQAHAHNDYLHARPLLDAVENGFSSVEADVFLRGNELLVAHTLIEIDLSKTLKGLYLEPLRDLVQRNQGTVQPGLKHFTLLIDFKTSGDATYVQLDQTLEEYKDLFVRNEHGQHVDGPVVAIISGNRPIAKIKSDPTRYVSIDGRLSDLESQDDAMVLPLISDNWNNHFTWRGKGPVSDDDLKKLRTIVQQVHAKNRRLRFWASPDRPEAWKLFQDEGIDLINTDNLKGLNEFLSQR
jgi:hypothetical protein